MKRRSLFVIGLIIVVAGFAVGQKSLTNSDLEKYRQQRVKAEQEYRDNYARWGMPSPEELARQREQSREETFKLAARLRDDQIQRDRMEAEREASERFVPVYEPQYPYQGFSSDYFWPTYWSNGLLNNGFGRGRRLRHRPYVQPGYYAGGQFWPTGSSTKSRPMFRTPRARPRQR